MNWSVIAEDVGFTLSAVAPMLLIAKTHMGKSRREHQECGYSDPVIGFKRYDT